MIRKEAQTELVKRQRKMEQLTRDAGERLDYDPCQSAQTLLEAMDAADETKEIVPAATEATARRWMNRRLNIVMEGHTNNLLAVDWSSDGRWVVTGGYDGMLRFWDAENDWLPAGVVNFVDTICQVRFSPQGDRIAIADEDGKRVALWSFSKRDFEWSHEIDLKSKPTELQWSPDGNNIFISGKMVLKLSASSGTEISSWSSEVQSQIHALSVASDGINFAYGADDTLYIRQTASKAPPPALEDQKVLLPFRPMKSVWLQLPEQAVDVDGVPSKALGGPALALTTDDARVFLWRPGEKAALQLRTLGVPKSIRALGNHVIIGTDEGNIEGFSPEDDGNALFPPITSRHRVTGLAQSPDEKWVAMVSASDRLGRIYSQANTAAPYAYDELVLPPNQEAGIAFSPDGTHVAAGARIRGTIYLGTLNKDNPEKLDSNSLYRIPKGDELSGRMAWSQHFLAAAYRSGNVRLWRGVTKDEKPLEVKISGEPLIYISSRVDKDEFVVTSISGRVFLLSASLDSAPKFQELNEFGHIVWATWSWDGKTIIGFDRESQFLATWSEKEGKVRVPKPKSIALSPLAEMEIIQIASRPHNAQVALAGLKGELVVVDIIHGGIIASRAGNGTPVFDFDWSPNGAVLAAARYDGTVLCLRGGDLEVTHEVRTDSPALTGIRWHPDGGRLFASGRSDTHSIFCIAYPTESEIRAQMNAYVRECARRSLSATSIAFPPPLNPRKVHENDASH